MKQRDVGDKNNISYEIVVEIKILKNTKTNT